MFDNLNTLYLKLLKYIISVNKKSCPFNIYAREFFKFHVSYLYYIEIA